MKKTSQDEDVAGINSREINRATLATFSSGNYFFFSHTGIFNSHIFYPFGKSNIFLLF